ncbi:MAG TPA: hypothetical protein VJT75_15930, partial [Thermoleophilaceae bacterium]|nr:hypothetical protein [Thermoleophilaceae bacterium]
GCGDGDDPRPPARPAPKPELFGEGPRFFPKPNGEAVRRARPANGMPCERRARPRHLAHLETFVGGRVVLMPAGIGIAPPHRRDGAYVRGGRCDYPLRTVEPTGLIEVERGRRPTLGDLFDLWGQPLSRRRVLSFRGRVRAYVGYERVAGDPRAIRLGPHVAVTLEIGRYVRPHGNYVFPR